MPRTSLVAVVCLALALMLPGCTKTPPDSPQPQATMEAQAEADFARWNRGKPAWMHKPFYFPGKAVEGYRLDEQLAEQVEAGHVAASDETAWRVAGTSSEIVHSPGRSIHLQVNNDLGDLHKRGVYENKSYGPTLWIRLPEGLDLTKYNVLYFWAKIQGARAAYSTMGFVNEPISWGSATREERQRLTGVASECPYDAGPWSQYRVILSYRPEALPKCRWLAMKTHIQGHQPDEPAVTDIYIDDLVLVHEPLRKHVGWSIDPTVVTVTQAGFLPNHEKQALLAAENPAEAFAVCDVESHEPLWQGRARLVASAVGKTKVLDFTPFDRPGRYYIRAGKVRSPAFDIGPNAWDSYLSAIRNWIFNMRCGQETAYHGPCHLDDAYVAYPNAKANGEDLAKLIHQDTHGGWHDAGDCRTYYHYTYLMPAVAARNYAAGFRADRDGDGVDDSADQARRAVEQMLRLRDPQTGEFFVSIWHERGDFRRGNYWTDNIPGNDDDRRVQRHVWIGNHTAEGIESLAMFAMTFGEQFPDLAERALTLARDRWDYWFTPETGQAFTRPRYAKQWAKPLRTHNYRNLALYGKASLQMHLATGEGKYLDLARRCAKRLIRHQRARFFNARPMCGEVFTTPKSDFNRYEPGLFLADLMLALPGDPDYPAWRSALVRHVAWWVKPARAAFAPFVVGHREVPAHQFRKRPANFGIVLEKRKGKPSVYLVPDAERSMTDTTGAMCTMARALDDVDLQRLARLQTQWIVGRNPFGASFVCGYGEDCIDQFYSFAQGRMVGCVGTGFGMGKRTWLGRNVMGTPSILRPKGPEPFTKPAVKIVNGIIEATQPARLDLLVRQGGKPWAGPVRITWPAGADKTLFEGETDASGRLAGIVLDGGVEYRLHLGEVSLPLAALAGTQRTVTLDRDRLVTLTCDNPPTLHVEELRHIPVEVYNHGSAEVTLKLNTVVGANLRTPPTAEITIPAGQSRTLRLRARCRRTGLPWILHLRDAETGQWLLDLTGPADA